MVQAAPPPHHGGEGVDVSKKKSRTGTDRQQAIEATAWFSVLAHSRSVDDHAEAAKATEALDRLGVKVKWARPREAVST